LALFPDPTVSAVSIHIEGGRMTDEGSAAPRSLKGYLLLGVAFVTCPCHIPILLAVLAGTSLAGVLSQYLGFAVAGLSVMFLVSLLWGLKTLRGGGRERRIW
jgi:mercuric ion transport protein